MKQLLGSAFKSLAGLGALGLITGIVLIIVLPLTASIYGLVLAFKASLILFVVVLFVEPMPLILGVLALLGHPEVAQVIVNFVSKLLN